MIRARTGETCLFVLRPRVRRVLLFGRRFVCMRSLAPNHLFRVDVLEHDEAGYGNFCLNVRIARRETALHRLLCGPRASVFRKSNGPNSYKLLIQLNRDGETVHTIGKAAFLECVDETGKMT